MRQFLPIKGPGGRYLTPNEKVALLVLALTLVLCVLTVVAGDHAYADQPARNPVFGFVAWLGRNIGGGVVALYALVLVWSGLVFFKGEQVARVAPLGGRLLAALGVTIGVSGALGIGHLDSAGGLGAAVGGALGNTLGGVPGLLVLVAMMLLGVHLAGQGAWTALREPALAGTGSAFQGHGGGFGFGLRDAGGRASGHSPLPDDGDPTSDERTFAITRAMEEIERSQGVTIVDVEPARHGTDEEQALDDDVEDGDAFEEDAYADDDDGAFAGEEEADGDEQAYAGEDAHAEEDAGDEEDACADDDDGRIAVADAPEGLDVADERPSREDAGTRDTGDEADGPAAEDDMDHGRSSIGEDVASTPPPEPDSDEALIQRGLAAVDEALRVEDGHDAPAPEGGAGTDDEDRDTTRTHGLVPVPAQGTLFATDDGPGEEDEDADDDVAAAPHGGDAEDADVSADAGEAARYEEEDEDEAAYDEDAYDGEEAWDEDEEACESEDALEEDDGLDDEAYDDDGELDEDEELYDDDDEEGLGDEDAWEDEDLAEDGDGPVAAANDAEPADDGETLEELEAGDETGEADDANADEDHDAIWRDGDDDPELHDDEPAARERDAGDGDSGAAAVIDPPPERQADGWTDEDDDADAWADVAGDERTAGETSASSASGPQGDPYAQGGLLRRIRANRAEIDDDDGSFTSFDWRGRPLE